ncbi:hypothetical protein OZX67_08755 [Bifidobacterium sp. ESL0728]|uniref:hypothetical protein n=1 Tax=Bifidobacterium sp. ESL0728 TaxID=2983220 RepID=UPI0023FA079F|nr:hypothetical protein [Bifidobacterium sp. ESL0728]WEV58862.1 hypothetical protein OZX67_08755 [Bifidobacterium sp. ESL0728]
MSLTLIAKSDQDQELHLRKSTQGPEISLVKGFIHSLELQDARKKPKLAKFVFLEPEIDSGYPDIVEIQINTDFINNWVPDRNKLRTQDFRILSFLIRYPGRDVGEIHDSLGFKRTDIINSLDLLETCHMAYLRSKVWRTENLHSFFGIRKLIAIEAKMSDNRTAIHQAFRNTRFASQSYVLLGANSPSPKTVANSERFGIGIIAGDHFKKITVAQKRPIPGNYVTLQFNEWIGRKIIG